MRKLSVTEYLIQQNQSQAVTQFYGSFIAALVALQGDDQDACLVQMVARDVDSLDGMAYDETCEVTQADGTIRNINVFFYRDESGAIVYKYVIEDNSPSVETEWRDPIIEEYLRTGILPG
jgi:hypothetical protein